ncbi:MAG: class I tRNA ligase family protein, partial [Candidatus Saganbacteria bacterium]|nr:class I tRNA ligase family protein [Candidatus Saganbacteria bacterium]
VEHAVLHLLYSRFFAKVLHDEGLVHFNEPFTNLLTQGMVVKDGAKMSKSKGNVVDPDYIIEQFGADTARLFILFASPPERELEWSDKGLEGSFRFLARVWRLAINVIREKNEEKSGKTSKVERAIHQTIRGVTEDIERFSFNTAIAKLMTLTNLFYENKEEIRTWHLEQLLLMLSPFAPHLTEELWHKLGNKSFILNESWPSYDPEIAKEEQITIAIQVNGKLRETISVPRDASDEEIRQKAIGSEKIQSWTQNKEIVKVIVVPKKLVNIVTR